MIALKVRRTNDDPLDNTWEWLLLENGQPLAVSMRAYTTEHGARRAARRIKRELHECIIALDFERES